MKRSLILYCCLTLVLVWTSSATLINSGAMAQIGGARDSNWSNFIIDDVDWGYYVHHSYTSVAVDGEGDAHISYRGPDYNIRYATNQHSCWSSEVIYDGDSSAARENSIAIDSGNHPHISFSYSDGQSEDLKYAKNITGTWQITTIDTTLSAGMENDIAVDNNDNAHISHWEWNKGELRHSTDKIGLWATEVISNAGWNRTAIAVDSNDDVHIAYSHQTDLKYTNNSNGVWNITVVDPYYGYEPAIAIDSNDKVHVSYSGYNDLRYATNLSGTWQTTIITSGLSVGSNHSIAVDANNKIHISYYDPVNGDLKYATNLTGMWETYTIDSDGYVGRSNSIAVDNSNSIYVSYRDDSISPSRLNDAWGNSLTNIFAVGENGTILRYDSGIWSRMDSGIASSSYEGLTDIWGNSVADVFAVSDYGKILHYDGSTWSAVVTDTAAALYGIWGSSSSDVFAVGANGTVLHYNGLTWSKMMTVTTSTLYGVWGSSSSDVFAVGGYFGESDTIWHYDGNMWTTMDSGVEDYDYLTDIWGSSHLNVFAVSHYGDVFRYDGTTWRRVDTEGATGPLYLEGIWGISSSSVFILGGDFHNYGQIVYYNRGMWNTMLSAKLKYATNAPVPTCYSIYLPIIVRNR